MSPILTKNFVTAAIVAHPDRSGNAQRLVRLLMPPSTQFHVPATIFMDNEGMGCDDNHLRAWEWLSHQDSEWLMVLEDDALPVQDGFGAQLHRALTVAPAPIVSLYLGRSRPDFYQQRIAHALTGCSHPGGADAIDVRTPWLVCSRLLHCVGVVIRRDVVADMMKLLPEFTHHARAIDEGITEYARNASLPVAYTLPSLVDHADQKSYAVHSDINPSQGPRVAWAVGKRSEWSSEFRIM